MHVAVAGGGHCCCCDLRMRSAKRVSALQVWFGTSEGSSEAGLEGEESGRDRVLHACAPALVSESDCGKKAAAFA